MCGWVCLQYETGYHRKEEHESQLMDYKSVASIGYCPALVTICATIPNPQPGEDDWPSWHKLTFTEAAAVPSDTRDGERVVLGLAAQPTNAKTALAYAWKYLDTYYDAFWKPRIIAYTGKPNPYIDYKAFKRLRTEGQKQGEPFTDEMKKKTGEIVKHWGNVDLVFNVPSIANAAFTAPSMVVSILLMLWQLEPRSDWCVTGIIGPKPDFLVNGYGQMHYGYFHIARGNHIRHILLSVEDAELLRGVVAQRGETVEQFGMRLIGCKNMHEMVSWAIFKKKLADVL